MSGDTGIIFLLWEAQNLEKTPPVVESTTPVPIPLNIRIEEEVFSVGTIYRSERNKTNHPCPHCQT